MSTKAIKWSSLLLIIGGVSLAVPMLFHPDMSKPGYALLSAWVPVHVLFGIGALAGLAGLIVLYGAMSPKITVVGHVAFWFTIAGTALLTGLIENCWARWRRGSWRAQLRHRPVSQRGLQPADRSLWWLGTQTLPARDRNRRGDSPASRPGLHRWHSLV